MSLIFNMKKKMSICLFGIALRCESFSKIHFGIEKNFYTNVSGLNKFEIIIDFFYWRIYLTNDC